MISRAEQLVAECIVAAADGADFPTVWRTILKGHPSVTGLPIQRVNGETALLEVRLISGERIVVGPGPHDYVITGGKGDGAVF